VLHLIHDLIDAAMLAELAQELADAHFVDGTASASGMARRVKHNRQLDLARHGALLERVRERIVANAEFRRLAMPLRLTGMQLARYEPGMHYGNHVDGAMIGNVRTDLSFTLWLCGPDEYRGGALVIDGPLGEAHLRPSAGSLVLYSSGDVHRVEAVEEGTRTVVIGWVQSLIRDDHQRGIAADMQWLLTEHLRRAGHDAHAERLLKCQQALLRMWIEPQAN
jgi:PKHD-type hydroxylase